MHITHTFSAYYTIFLPLSFSLHSRRDCPCLCALDSSQQCFTHIWHYVDTIKTFELVNYDIIFRKLGARELPCSLLHPLLHSVYKEKRMQVYCTLLCFNASTIRWHPLMNPFHKDLLYIEPQEPWCWLALLGHYVVMPQEA